jgi:hypothetical protein
VTTYTIDQAKARVVWKQSLRNSVIMYSALGALLLAAINRGNFSPSGIISLLAGAGAMVLTMALLLWASYRTFRKQVTTFRIVLDDRAITREAAQVPSVTIPLEAITVVEEYPKVGIQLRTDEARTRLFVPHYVERFDELSEQVVGGRKMVRKQSQLGLLLRCAAYAAIPAVLIIMLYSSTSIGLATLIGLVMIIGALVAAAVLQRNGNIPRWFKITSWLGVPLTTVIVLIHLSGLDR